MQRNPARDVPLLPDYKTNRDTETSSEGDPAGPRCCRITNTHWSTDTSSLQSFIPTFQFSSLGGRTIHSWNTSLTWQRVYLRSMPRVSQLSSSSNTLRLSSHSSWKTKGHQLLATTTYKYDTLTSSWEKHSWGGEWKKMLNFTSLTSLYIKCLLACIKDSLMHNKKGNYVFWICFFTIILSFYL